MALTEGLIAAGSRLGIPLQVIGPPSFPEVIFGEAPVHDYRSYVSSNRSAAKAFGLELLRRGLYVKPGGKWFLSTAHETRHIDQALDAAESALSAIQSAGYLEAVS
jgi:glutamate-1-semialdehyde 2,1-aminomutase